MFEQKEITTTALHIEHPTSPHFILIDARLLSTTSFATRKPPGRFMMHSSIVHLPNGYTFNIIPVFGGLTFKSNELNPNHSIFPPGWTIILRTQKSTSPHCTARQSLPVTVTEDGPDASVHHSHDPSPHSSPIDQDGDDETQERFTSRFTTPTLNCDFFYMSSIFLPSHNEFKPAISPTRQIAMMLWATLWWYFHEPEPNLHVWTNQSSLTPEAGRPKGDWRIYIRREGVLKGRNLMQKLERMGLLSTEDSTVGLDGLDVRYPSGWNDMFVSRQSFWQLDPRIFLFTFSPTEVPYSGMSPYESRSISPVRDPINSPAVGQLEGMKNWGASVSVGPFTSGSHLPTFFPPAPTQYTFTNGVRHPIRPKPPRQGETFYTRFVPSVSQTISFRIPILPNKASKLQESVLSFHRKSRSMSSLSDSGSGTRGFSLHGDESVSDLELLHKWMNNPRVNAVWAAGGPQPVQEKFLIEQLTSRHSFPVFGCWDGRPFGYFEIYWVKEDPLARLLGGQVDNYDRGIHCLVGEEEFRGSHRVAIWLSSLVHCCWLADNRTQTVMLEPRVDNKKSVCFIYFLSSSLCLLPEDLEKILTNHR